MGDILAKKNRHLFLEEKDNIHNSFISNINYAVENIDTIKTFNNNVNSGTMQHLLEAYIEQVGVEGNAWVLKLTELGESILATASGFNYAAVFTATTDIDAEATITLPEAMKYRVGTHMLLVSWNGTVCYNGDQYEEIGAFNERSTTIKIKQPIKIGDKLEFRTVALADTASVTLALGDTIDHYPIITNNTNIGRTVVERFSDIINVKDFGAIGDGMTDDTAAIRAAMVAAIGSGSSYVYFPKGRYVFSLAENEQLSLLPFIGDSAVLLVDGKEHELAAYRSGFLEYEKQDAFVIGFGYYRAWPNNGADASNKPNFSTALVSADGTTFHNIGNFDTTFKDELNECRWGYIPTFYNGKLYLSWTYNGKAGYYITKDLKTFETYEYQIPIASPGDHIEPDEGKFVYLRNVNGTWYSVFYVFKDEAITTPTESQKAVREYYYATGNPDTNTWNAPTAFSSLNSSFTDCFDVSFFEDDGVFYIVGQEMTTRQLKLLKSDSFTSGYTVVKYFNTIPYYLESPSIIKYNGKYFLYALAYETGTLVCFVSDDMENWSDASGIYYDRGLNFGRAGGNLRFLSCFVADTEEKKKLVFDYMKYSGASMSLGNDFIYKNTGGYGVAVPFSVQIEQDVAQDLEIESLTLMPNSVYVLDKNCEVTIKGVDTSLMKRGDKCWFLVFHGASTSRIVFKSSAWSSTFSRSHSEGLSPWNDEIVIGSLTKTAFTLVKCEAFFVNYLITCYLDVSNAQQWFRSDEEIVDLDDITITSFWTFTNQQAVDGANFPYAEMGFLKVENNGTAVLQEYVLRNSRIVYRRVYNPGVGWSTWDKESSINEFVRGRKIYTHGPYGIASQVSAADISLASGSVFTKTVAADTEFTFSNAPSGAVSNFDLILTNGGAYTVTWPSSVKWAGGSAPTLTISGIDVLHFMTPNGGTTWYGKVDAVDVS